MSENPQSWFYIIVGILAGLTVIKTAWADVLLPIVSRVFNIEIKNKQNSELKKIKEEINKKIDCLNEKFDNYEQHRQEEKELNILMLEGVTATLLRLKELGANGTVSGVLNEIESYKNKKAVS